jgi:hypothetical protein
VETIVEEATVVESVAVEARKETLAAVKRVVCSKRMISIRISSVRFTEGRDMMQSTVVKLPAIGNLTNRQAMVLESQIGHINQVFLVLIKCPQMSTRLIANNTELEPARDPNKWIVDSAANAYITSFKNTLYNYVDFCRNDIRQRVLVERKKLHMDKVLSC